MKSEPVKLVPRKRVRVKRADFTSVVASTVKKNGPKQKKIASNEGEPFVKLNTTSGAEEDLKSSENVSVKHEELGNSASNGDNDDDIDYYYNNNNNNNQNNKNGNMGPMNWQLFLEKVRYMRQIREAPVDTMGCERVGANGGPLPPKTVRFQHLVALMLSSQTKDEITAGAVGRLREKLTPTLTPEAVVATPEKDLEQIILPVGFFRRKAQYLRGAAQILLDRYDGDIPHTIEEITELPGVGPKMGYLLLQAAWKQVDGIGVDVHVHRLAQLWHWVPKVKTPTPERTRLELEKWLPRSLWAEINPLLVGFGQTWCPPRSSVKTCSECHLFDLCPSAKRR